MKKITKIILVLLVVVLLSGCVDKTTDAYKFKEEYESINNEKNENNGKKYRELSIPSDNPIVYATAKDIVEKIDNKETFIVYFGFKECPWCRSIITELLNVAKAKEVDKIYYVDVKDIRDVKEVDDDGNIKTTKKGDKYYLELVEKLGDVLSEYTLTKDEETIEVGEKRIYAPNVVAVSNGKAIQMETGISDELTDPYGKLTKKVKKYAYNKFKCLVECLEEEATTCKKDMC